MEFRPAVREKQKARIALYGPSKSGKTYTGLILARALAGGKVAVIDTEHESSELYAGEFTFDILPLRDHNPDNFVKALQLAASEGYGAVLIDSGSHAWMGTNGILELVDAKTPAGGSSFSSGWNAVRPIESRFWDTLLGVDMHVIMTLRSKQVYEMVEEQGRKPRPRKVGLGPIQRDGLEYEFDILLELDLDHNATIAGSRYAQLPEGTVVPSPDEAFGAQILDMLNQGSDPVIPEEASEEDVAKLTKLLIEGEGRDQRKLDDAYAARKAMNRGVLPKEWVDFEIQKAEERIAQRPAPEETKAEEAKADGS